MLVFFTIALFASEIFFRNDSQFFQVVSGMATGAMGAFLTIITGHKVFSRTTDQTPTDTSTDATHATTEVKME